MPTHFFLWTSAAVPGAAPVDGVLGPIGVPPRATAHPLQLWQAARCSHRTGAHAWGCQMGAEGERCCPAACRLPRQRQQHVGTRSWRIDLAGAGVSWPPASGTACAAPRASRPPCRQGFGRGCSWAATRRGGAHWRAAALAGVKDAAGAGDGAFKRHRPVHDGGPRGSFGNASPAHPQPAPAILIAPHTHSIHPRPPQPPSRHPGHSCVSSGAQPLRLCTAAGAA